VGGTGRQRREERDIVRAWRPEGVTGLVVMDGVVWSHAAEPRGEYMVGVIGGRATHLMRGGRRHVLRPGSLAVLDPSLAHRGVPAEGGPWRCRLMIMELPDVCELANDPDRGALSELAFPDPEVGDAGLAARFVGLHQLLTGPASSLERQSALAAWWQDAARWSQIRGRQRARPAGGGGRDEAALRRALAALADDPARDVSLAELAAAAGMSQYRLVQRFRARFGMPPHAFQIAQRVTRARRLLESGVPASMAAARAGFHDQSHLHRHFRRCLGLTPAAYAAAFRQG
jgi:AraC-like DNA-binding protein